MAKQEPNQFTTPKGIAQYPWLSEPDTKYKKPDGEYKVDLIIPKADAIPVLKQINEVFAENVDKETKRAKGQDVVKAKPPYWEELDDAKQPTGNVVVRFKSQFKPAIFDAKGIPMVNNSIWGGSELKVTATIGAWCTPLLGAGVSLYLKAVQVIQYVEGRSGGAEAFGFTEEAGYEHKAPETLEEIEASNTPVETAPPPAEATTAEPKVRAASKPDVQPADDLSDIINQWATK